MLNLRPDVFFDYQSFYTTLKSLNSSVEEINKEYKKYLKTLSVNKQNELGSINIDNDIFLKNFK